MTIVGEVALFIGAAVFIVVMAGYGGVRLPFGKRAKTEEQREAERLYRKIMNPVQSARELRRQKYHQAQPEPVELDFAASRLIPKPAPTAMSERGLGQQPKPKTKISTQEIDGKVFIIPPKKHGENQILEILFPDPH